MEFLGYIEVSYDEERRHSTMGGISPAEARFAGCAAPIVGWGGQSRQ